MKTKDLKQFESEDASPHAGSMIESFRSIGYSFQAAVADIIDNSIAAKAKNIWIDFMWRGQNTYMIITDDGLGMDQSELINAMRPGSKNPLTNRDDEDLGRFGLGLKTASFSQCRVLTVATKTAKKEIIHRTWNLDYVNLTGKWKLLTYLKESELLERLSSLNSGTSVIWQSFDRLIPDTDSTEEQKLNHFLEIIKDMEMHLQMVFHMYIESGKFKIWIQDRKIQQWDPYLRNNTNTVLFQEKKLRNNIIIKCYILPHHSKLNKDEEYLGSWIKGWNAHQGFYIYRNKRMIISGEWLGLFKQEEHNKLARILVNIPSSVNIDHEWHLDIKKSSIKIPFDIRQELKSIAENTRKNAVEVYRQIGKRTRSKNQKEDIPVWMAHKWNGKRSYQINKEHPVIKSLLEQNNATPTFRRKLQRVLKLIEETLPLSVIVINESENQDAQNIPFEGKSLSDLITIIVELFESLIEQGYSKENAISEILRTEPFSHYPELTEHLNRSF